MASSHPRLSTIGSQTFADAVTLDVLSGLTDLVGPDGCGRSNVVVVPQLGSLGRSLAEMVRWAGRISAAGAGVRSLAGVIGGLAELDRDAGRARIHTGLAAARAQGRRGGRRPKLTAQQEAVMADEVLSGRETGTRMARRYKVSAATVSRVVTAHRAEAGAAVASGTTDGGGHPGERIAGVLPVAALDEGRGAAPVQLIGTHALACVADVSGLGSSAARRGFMTAFAEALYLANTEPLHLVLDEADL